MNSAEYWRLREEKQRLKNIKDEKEHDKKIKEIYQRMMDEVQSEINNFYAKYAKDTGITLAETKKRASNLDMEAYSRKAKKYVEEKNFSKQANAEMKLYNLTMKVNRLELLKANIGLALVSGHDELEKYMDELLENRTLDEIQRQAGILGPTILDNADTVHSIVNASFHNATFSDRIWMHQDLLKYDLESLLATGLIQGKNPNELARLLRKRFNVKISDAQRLMRTELARVQIAAQQKSYEANGFDEYEYITCGIGDACDTCRALDGKVFPINRMNVGDNAPPMHPNCHCSTGPHMDRKIYNEWLDGLASGKHSLRFDEYKTLKNTKETESSKKVSYKNSVVSKNMLNSSKFRRQFDKLSNDKNVNRNVYYLAKQILEHRSGTKYEDLAYIDTKTGKTLISNKRNIDFSCVPTKEMSKFLDEIDDYSIIGMHNHPGSSVPSINDLVVAGKRKYLFGLVVCHNGNIYKYLIKNSDKFNINIASLALDVLQKDGYTKRVEEMFEDAGVIIEVISNE